jgi:hypothetical protein
MSLPSFQSKKIQCGDIGFFEKPQSCTVDKYSKTCDKIKKDILSYFGYTLLLGSQGSGDLDFGPILFSPDK